MSYLLKEKIDLLKKHGVMVKKVISQEEYTVLLQESPKTAEKYKYDNSRGVYYVHQPSGENEITQAYLHELLIVAKKSEQHLFFLKTVTLVGIILAVIAILIPLFG